MCVSGCKNHYESVLVAGAKAKSVTSLLTLPSVLADGIINYQSWSCQHNLEQLPTRSHQDNSYPK